MNPMARSVNICWEYFTPYEEKVELAFSVIDGKVYALVEMEVLDVICAAQSNTCSLIEARLK